MQDLLVIVQNKNQGDYKISDSKARTTNTSDHHYNSDGGGTSKFNNVDHACHHNIRNDINHITDTIYNVGNHAGVSAGSTSSSGQRGDSCCNLNNDDSKSKNKNFNGRSWRRINVIPSVHSSWWWLYCCYCLSLLSNYAPFAVNGAFPDTDELINELDRPSK